MVIIARFSRSKLGRDRETVQSCNCAERNGITPSCGDWKDSNSIHVLTRPVKVSSQKWREFTTDCASIVAEEKGFRDVFFCLHT